MNVSVPEDTIASLRLLWLDSIEQIASLEMQRVSWLNPTNKNPHWSFSEFVESYFEQFSILEGYEYAIAQGIVSRDESLAVASFHDALKLYVPPGGDQWNFVAILDDPEWKAITLKASLAIARLLALSFNNSAYLTSFRDA